MQCQLSDIHKGMLIRRRIIECVQLHDAVSHEGQGGQNGRDIGRGAEFRTLRITQIGHFETVFDEGVGLGDGQLSDTQKGLEADELVFLGGVEGGTP